MATVAPPAIAGKNRIAKSESPIAARLSLATSATIGGRSTYPHARWRPHAMKYNSSRKYP